MNTPQQQAQMLKLIERVEQNDKTEFRLIKSFKEFQVTKNIRTAVKYVIIGFKRTADKVLKNYLSVISRNSDDIELFVSYRKLLICIDFYQQEYNTLTDMIKEYRCYTRNGHILVNLVFQQQRPKQDMVDYRKLPWTWF